MGKIFKDIEDLAKEGGKFDIPEVNNEETQKDLSDKRPPDPSPTPKQGKDDPRPPEANPQEFESRDGPSETSPFEHKEKEDLRPKDQDPVRHTSDGGENIGPPDRRIHEESDQRPSKTEPFDHVSEARNRPDDIEEFDHVSSSDRANVRDASKFEHRETSRRRPDDTSQFDHAETERSRPDDASMFEHKEDEDLSPSESSPFSHEEDSGLIPSESSPFSHEEDTDLTPSDTSTFEHEEDESLRPSDDEPYQHEENEDLTPNDASTFEHEEDEDLTPNETSPFEHKEDEDLTPSDTSPYEHEEDESLRPSDDEVYQHEQNEDLVPPEDQLFEHEEDESLRPPDDEIFEHKEDEDLTPSDTTSFEHEEDESLRPPDDEIFEHEEDQELRPPDAISFEHEEDEELRPPDDEVFEHEKNEDLTPSDTSPYEHEEDEGLRPPDDEIFEHEENESLRPSDATLFEHEEDESLRPPDDEIFEHEEDQELRPSDTSPFSHEEDESLRPPDDEVFEHEEDENLRPSDTSPYEHEEDESLRPPDDEVFEHEDRGLRPPDDEIFEHEENEELGPSDTSPYDHEEDNSIRPSDAEQTPLDVVYAINEGNLYPNFWEEDSAQAIRPGNPYDNEGVSGPLPTSDSVLLNLISINTETSIKPNYWTADGGEQIKPGNPYDLRGLSGPLSIENSVLNDLIVINSQTGNEPNYWNEGGLEPIKPGNPYDLQGISGPLPPGDSILENVISINTGTDNPRHWIANTLNPDDGDGGAAIAPGIPYELEPNPRLPVDRSILYDPLIQMNEDTGYPVYWTGSEVNEIQPRAVFNEEDREIFLGENEEIRTQQFDNLWEGGGLAFFAGGAPYGPLIRPDSDRASRLGNDSRNAPVFSTLRDQERIANFLTSVKGAIFLGKQAVLQLLNPRNRTKFINPLFLNENAVPFVHTTKHISPGESALGSLINAVGGNIKSAKFSDEIEEVTDDWGYLVNSLPVSTSLRDPTGEYLSDPEIDIEDGVHAQDFANAIREKTGSTIDNLIYRSSSLKGPGGKLKKFADAARSSLSGGSGDDLSFNYFLGTQPNTGFYTRGDNIIVEKTGVKDFVSYTFVFPYIDNAIDIDYPIEGETVTPSFNFIDDIEDAFGKVKLKRSQEEIFSSPPGFPPTTENEELSEDISSRLEDNDKNRAVRSSENVALSFYGRSDGISSIAEYENLPKQSDDYNGEEGEDSYGGGMLPVDDTDEKAESAFYQNKISADQQNSPLSADGGTEKHGPQIFLHQSNASEEDKSYGLPNYGADQAKDDVEASGDLIDEMGVIDLDEESEINGNVQLSNEDHTYENENGSKFKDLIPFKIKDKQNQNLLVFRAFLDSISLNSSIQWDTQEYLGRPEQFHIYGGAQREISVNFQTHPFSHDGLKAQYEKLNYLQGLIYPSDFVFLGDDTDQDDEDDTNTGAYMIPPFLELTVGDIYNGAFGYINSLSITPEGDSTWSMVEGEKLPEHVSVDMTYTIIEDGPPQTGKKFFDTKAFESMI